MLKIGYFCLFILSFSVSGCTTSKQVAGPNGLPVHVIDCSNALDGMAGCLEKAGELCLGKGYEIVGSSSSQSPVVISTSYNTSVYQTNTRELIVQCK